MVAAGMELAHQIRAAIYLNVRSLLPASDANPGIAYDHVLIGRPQSREGFPCS